MNMGREQLLGRSVLLSFCGWTYRQGTEHGGALTIRPPTKRARDTSTQAQFTHGQPPGSANKRFAVAGGGHEPEHEHNAREHVIREHAHEQIRQYEYEQ